MTKPQFIIAAPTSNAGKTTVTLGLLKAFQKRGLFPQSFKCGPDYIDPKFHEVASGQQGINLDLFMMSEEHILETYAEYTQNTEVACVEGVMGLFDGARKDEGSTAALAKKLQLPVVLVVDAKAVAYSVAPLLYGFKNFDSEIEIAGVIFNRVNTESHYQFLVEACEDVGVQPLGYLPFIPDAEIPSRHLGLSIDQLSTYEAYIEKYARALEAHINIEELLVKTTRTAPIPIEKDTNRSKTLKIAIAQDEAFNFTYPQTIKSWEQIGTVTYFSPLKDKVLPQADLVYLPGGYPELYIHQLAANESMLSSIKSFVELEGKVIAECGGMMYLGKSMVSKEGVESKMTNVFPYVTTMQEMKLHLGYRTFEYQEIQLKGHEFHYSSITQDENVAHIGKIKTARNKEITTKIYRYKNVLASYVHFYLGTPKAIDQFLKLISKP